MIEKVKPVNPHFEDFLFDWNQKFQFLVGGYGSSKSYHVALKIVLKLLEEKRTVLVVREVYDTHRDSTFSLFDEIINDLEIDHIVRCVSSPMQIRFPNGGRIIFKGLDKPAKLKSINNVSLIWIMVDNREIIKPNLEKALKKIEELQVDEDNRGLVLSYNDFTKEIIVVDRQLFFYRKHRSMEWPWESMIAEIEESRLKQFSDEIQ